MVDRGSITALHVNRPTSSLSCRCMMLRCVSRNVGAYLKALCEGSCQCRGEESSEGV